MKEDILKLIQDKQSGTTEAGTKIYSNITEEDLNKIISASIVFTVNKIRNKIEVAGDEWETVVLVEDELNTLIALTEESDLKKTKKNKIK